MSTAPILDQSALLKQLDGDEDLWREIMDIIFDDTPKQIGALPAAIEDPDPPLVQRLAHTIKGSSGNVGAPALQAAAWQLEQAAESDDLGCAHSRAGEYADTRLSRRHRASSNRAAAGAADLVPAGFARRSRRLRPRPGRIPICASLPPGYGVK